MLADNWWRPTASSSTGSRRAGARVETADIRDRARARRLIAGGPRRVCCSPLRPAARSPSAIPTTPRRRTSPARAASPRRSLRSAAAELVHASSLHVYGARLAGEVGPDRAVGPSRATSRTCRRSTPSSRSRIHARARRLRRSRYCRLGIVYGPSPVEHDAPDSQTVVDKFRRLAARGRAADARRRRARDDRRRARRGRGAAAARARCRRPARSPLQRRRRDADGGRRRRAGRGRASRPAAPRGRSRRSWSTSTASRSTSRDEGSSSPARPASSAGAPRRCWPSADTTCSRSPARAAPRARRPRPAHAIERVDAGDPAARDLVAGRDVGAALRRRPRPGARAARTRPRAVRENAGTTAEPARRLPRAWRRADLPLDRARGARAAARRLRALQAAGRGGLPPPRARARRSCG